MTEPFDVAVVIPHYNQPQCLRRAVAALRDQRTERRLQVVIVDDGSRRRPTVSCSPVGSISFDIVHAEHGGPAAARNLGLAKVAAPIVAFTDADCVPEPDWVASVVHHFEVTPTTDAITGPLVDLTKPKRLNVLHRFFHKGSILDHAPQRFSYGGVDMLGMIGANMAMNAVMLEHGLDVEDLNLGSSIVESVTNLPTFARGHFGLVGRLPAAPLLAESCFQAGAASARRRLRANP